MKEGHQMDIHELRAYAAKLIEDSKWKNRHVATEIGISNVTLSRALTSNDGTGAATLSKVVALFTNYEVEKKTIFEFRQKLKRQDSDSKPT